jgi:vitamin B12 transporter
VNNRFAGIAVAAFCNLVFASAFPEDTLHGSTASAGEERLDPVIVTACRRAQPAQWVSDDHQLIDVNRLQLSTSQTISELLASFVPARITDYGSGGLKNISLRGAGSQRTLLLIDGKRTGAVEADYADLSVNNVEKIEIIEGGQSAIYGMDAVGGVVNIITKRAHSDQLSGTGSVGISSFEARKGIGNWEPSLNGNNVNVAVGRNYGDFGFSGGGSWNKSDGRYSYSDENKVPRIRENNGFEDWNAFQRIAYQKDAVNLEEIGTYCRRIVGNPGTLAYPSLALTRKRAGAVAVNAGYTPFRALTLKLNSSYAYEFTRFHDPDPFFPQDGSHERSNGSIELLQEFTLKKQLVNTGIQLLRSELKSNEIGNHASNQIGIFANGIFTSSAGFFRFECTPAIRCDNASTFGTTLNGKMGAMVTAKIPLTPSFFVNTGSSYKAPTFDDLFWPQDAFAQGNPELKPEKSVNADVGIQVRYDADRISPKLRVSYYRLRLTDMILWAEGRSGLWMPKNISKASINGCKIDVTGKIHRTWNLGCTYHFNDARDDKTDRILIYRPKHMATFSVDHFGAVFNAGASYTYSSRIFIDDANTLSLPDWHAVNVHSGYKLPVQFNALWLVYDLLNATNQQRRTNEGYPLPGREHRLSMKVQF